MYFPYDLHDKLVIIIVQERGSVTYSLSAGIKYLVLKPMTEVKVDSEEWCLLGCYAVWLEGGAKFL
jgi:hypothetical protein